MRADTAVYSNLQPASTIGYYSANDGGAGSYYYDASSSAADDGWLTIKQTSNAGNGRWKLVITPGRYNVKQAGAKGDNSTDDTAAIQLVINYTQSLTPKGGTVYFPAGSYIISTQLSCPDTKGITLLGEGIQVFTSRLTTDRPISTLVFTSSGSGLPVSNLGWPSFIDARSADGFEIRHLGILQTSGSFTGLYVDFGHSSVANDAAGCRVIGCVFSNTYFDGVIYQVSARAAISFSDAIECSVEKTTFYRTLCGIRGQEAIGNSLGYSNVIAIRDCQFIQTPTAIANPGQTWIIEGNTVEGLGSATWYSKSLVADDITASGSIQEIAKASHANGDTITFNDGGFTASTVFEYRVTAGTVAAGHIKVDVSGATTAADCAAILVAAINGAGLRLTTAVANNSALVIVNSNLDRETHPYTITATAAGQTCVGMVTPTYSHDLLSIRNNWLGDAFGQQIWLKLLPCTTTEISGNLFEGTPTCAIQFYANSSTLACGGVEITRNEFNPTSGNCIDFDRDNVGIIWKGLNISLNQLQGTTPFLHKPNNANLFGNDFDANSTNLNDQSVNGVIVYPQAKDPTQVTVGGGAKAWWKADSLVLSNGAAVSTWTDSTGNGFNLLQATGLNQPTYHTGGQGVLPIVRFDGTNSFMQAAFTLFGNLTTVFIAFVANGSRVGNDTIIDGVSGIDTLRMYRKSTYAMSVGGVTLAADPQRFTVYCLSNNGVGEGSSIQRVADLAIQGDPAWSAGSTGGVTVGRSGAGTLPISADVGEIIVYDRVMVGDEAKAIMNYLRAKWICF